MGHCARLSPPREPALALPLQPCPPDIAIPSPGAAAGVPFRARIPAVAPVLLPRRAPPRWPPQPSDALVSAQQELVAGAPRHLPPLRRQRREDSRQLAPTRD